MNFCAAILILKMKENNANIFNVLCFINSRKVKTQLKHQKNLCAVHGKGAVTDSMCQKWFAKFLGTVDILAK